MERFSLELKATEVFYGKTPSCTKVVGLVEMSRLVQVHQRASHAPPPSPTALCERLWARTLMTTRYLPAVDVQGTQACVVHPRNFRFEKSVLASPPCTPCHT